MSKRLAFLMLVIIYSIFAGFVYLRQLDSISWIPSASTISISIMAAESLVYLTMISISTYYFGAKWGYIAAALTIPLLIWNKWHFVETLDLWVGIGLRIVVDVLTVVIVGHLVETRKALQTSHDELQNTHNELQKATDEMKTLKGLISVCSVCGKVRNEAEEWVGIQNYVREHSNADFTHSYCPACFDIALAEVNKG